MRSARELDAAAVAVATKIEQALEQRGTLETTTLSEWREPIEALKRGSSKPRSHEPLLRREGTSSNG